MSAAFLLVWLGGWVFGEVFALGFLIMLLRSVAGALRGVAAPIPSGEWIAGGAAGGAFLFLVVWLSLWTFGGWAAVNELLRSLAGEDRVEVRGADVALVRRAGPFQRTRLLPRSAIRRVRLRGDSTGGVVIDTTTSTEPLTSYGTAADRAALVAWLQQRLGLPPTGATLDVLHAPPGWEMKVSGDITQLRRGDAGSRRIGVAISWTIAALTALIAVGTARQGAGNGLGIAVGPAALLAAWATWATWSDRAWLVRRGEIIAHRRFAFWEWNRAFHHAQLDFTTSTDSDGDRHYQLWVRDASGRKRITSVMNDDAETLDLGRWLAARTGFELKT